MPTLKDKIKIANEILSALSILRQEKLDDSYQKLTRFIDNFKDMQRHVRILGLAVSKNYLSAAKSSCRQIENRFCDLRYVITTSQQMFASPSLKMPALADILAELDQIEADLGQYQYEPGKKTVSVITEPISLEEVYLGQFEIQLCLDRLSDMYRQIPYYVIAVDPHPAATDENVTHPHVSCDQLCAGDGTTAINKALEQGRICDFYHMVTNILKVYNADSPYVSIDQWEGISCYDCGYVMSEDQVYYCEFCQCDYCDECTVFCPCCEDNSACLGCCATCEFCGDTVCPECFRKCSECSKIVCLNCIENEANLCPDCKKESEVENEKEKVVN